ncbi:hypothetical protein [Burkholderia ambifaria]|uniref:hypothetical protein n=1 Tax=Burkholderia ambifaria TaxID=152480 RepID=UPI000F802ADE|nr:hypothetical protein [Burkholderia ambifaria]
MWPFLLTLAIVPMVFFWSDDVTSLFPQLAHYLPGKTAAKPQTANGAVRTPGVDGSVDALPSNVVSEWTETSNERGYVAWAQTADGTYRLVIGCHPQERARAQLLRADGRPVPATLTLNYRYGALTLASGAYSSADLVGAVAQFKDVTLLAPGGAAVATITLDAVKSGMVARALQSSCVQ